MTRHEQTPYPFSDDVCRCSACQRRELIALVRPPVIESPPLAPYSGPPVDHSEAILAADLKLNGPSRSRQRRRTVVAFTGLAGSGKSTAAAHLVNAHGFTRVRFAGPLKDMMRALGLSADEIDGPLKEAPCALLGGRTPRYAMQTIGTEWGRDIIAADLWIRAWHAAVDRLPPGAPVVVDDCRFPNEAAAVRSLGGVVVRIDRPGAGTTSAHSSEGQDLGEAITVRNDADVGALRLWLDVLLDDHVAAGEFRDAVPLR